MEFLLDTVNLEKISYYNEHLSLAGVTSNPSILKKDGIKGDLFEHFRKIRMIFGSDRQLHVQVTGCSFDEMEADAKRIVTELGNDVYIKVPTNLAGLKTMKSLKKQGLRVTATAIYTEFQAYQALNVGADYLAPYYNRMLNQGIDAAQIIENVAKRIGKEGLESKILAASFHNVDQVNQAIRSGAQAVTVGLTVVEDAFEMPAISKAIADFKTDWEKLYSKDLANL